MSHRSKSSAKLDSSQSEPLSYKRTKRLRIESDEDEDGYEQHQERRTSYNESYTRGGAGSNSPDPVVATKKPRLLARGSVDDEQSDSDAVARVYDDPDHDEYDGYDAEPERQREASYDEYEGRRGGKRSSPAPSSPPQMESSPLLQPQPPLHPPAGLTAESSSYVAPATGGRVRRMSLKAKYMSSQGPAASTPTIGAKGKGKQKAQRPVGTSKKRRRREEEEDEEEEYMDSEDENVDVDVEEEEEEEDGEARFSDEDDEDERPARGKKARGGGGRGKAKEKEKEDIAPAMKKAKFEGNPATLASMAGTKRPRAKKPTGEDSLVDIVGDTETPEPSSIGSPSIAGIATEAVKDDSAPSSAPPAKKRKLPTIKKLKASTSVGGSAGPSTPSALAASGGKPPTVPPPSSAGAAPNGASKLGIADGTKSTRPKTNATTDLDLSNPSLYAELFKNPAGNASRTGLNRRAKEEERRKELDKMRDEYKTTFAEQAKLSFDLQDQAEKMARFEELLRRRHSSALYPNFLAAKWREEWEREKRRAHKREHPQQAQQNGNANSVKEEGEM